jgi:flagellar hook-length control protein FliK
MSAINIDNLTLANVVEPSFTDFATSNSATSQSAFGDYLQWAQSQTTNQPAAGAANYSNAASTWDASSNSNASGNSNSTDAASSRASTSISPPQTDTSPAADRTAAQPADLNSQSSDLRSSSRRDRATPADSSQADPSPTSASRNESTNRQDHRNSGKQNTGSPSAPGANQAPAAASGANQAAGANNSAGIATAATANSPTVSAVAASVTPLAGNNPSAAARPAGGSTRPSGAPAAPFVANAPRASSASTANVQNGSAQSTVSQSADGQTNPVKPPSSSAEDPAVTTVVGSQLSAPSAGQTNNRQPTTDNGPTAAATAFIAPPELPAETKPPLASAGAGGGRTQSTGQSAETDGSPAATAVSDVTLTPDIAAVREQRANSTIESLSPSESNDTTNGRPAKPASSNSGPTAGPTPTTANATFTNGGTSAAPAADTNLSQADRVRFVQRVEQAFQDLSGQGGTVRLRLSPPELGSLHIQISLAKGELIARVEAETPAARNVLLDNLPALRDRLAQHDIRVQRFDVDLMDRSGSGGSNQSSLYQNPSRQDPSGSPPSTRIASGGDPLVAVGAVPSRPVSGSGRLNVVV